MQESVFKTAVFALTAFYAAVRAVYQMQYRRRHKKLRVHMLRESVLVTLVAVFWWGPTALYAFTTWIDFASIALPDWLRISGGIGMFVSIVFFWRVHSFLGKRWSPVLELEHDHTLIQDGPFRRLRHPMYSAIFASILFQFPLCANWIVFIPALASFLLLCVIRIPSEEAMLQKEFGSAYRDYSSRSWRLIPWIY